MSGVSVQLCCDTCQVYCSAAHSFLERKHSQSLIVKHNLWIFKGHKFIFYLKTQDCRVNAKQVYTESSSALKSVPNEQQQTPKPVFQSDKNSYFQSTIINPFSDRERLTFHSSPQLKWTQCSKQSPTPYKCFFTSKLQSWKHWKQINKTVKIREGQIAISTRTQNLHEEQFGDFGDFGELSFCPQVQHGKVYNQSQCCCFYK